MEQYLCSLSLKTILVISNDLYYDYLIDRPYNALCLLFHSFTSVFLWYASYVIFQMKINAHDVGNGTWEKTIQNNYVGVLSKTRKKKFATCFRTFSFNTCKF